MCDAAVETMAPLIDERMAGAGADAVLRAVAGLDRGCAASKADAESVDTAVATFEAIAPCELVGDDLVAYLLGDWRLAYSSSLVEQAGVASAESLRRLAATLVGVPTARSSLALGEVRCRIEGGDGAVATLSRRERLQLRWRVPWPLPQPPALSLAFTSTLELTGDDGSDADGGAATTEQLRTVLRDVSASVVVGADGAPGGGGRGGRGNRGGGGFGFGTLPSATLPAARVRAALDGALGGDAPWAAPLAALPTTKELKRIDAGAARLAVSAASGAVHVTRSALGEVRVWVREASTASTSSPLSSSGTSSSSSSVASSSSSSSSSGAAAGAASSVVSDDGGRSVVLDPLALREVARARREGAAEAEAGAREAAAAAAREKEGFQAMLQLAAAAEAAVAAEKADVERALAALEERAAEAAAAAGAELANAVELAEARRAAAEMVAAAELVDAAAAGEAAVAAARTAAAAERDGLAEAHSAEKARAEAAAAAELAAARQQLELATARFEQDAAAARAAFAAERQELNARLSAAEDSLDKAKAAAIAALGNL